MNAFNVGELVGMVLVSLLVPAIIMIAMKAIPATRHAHKATYGIAGTLAVLTPWVTAKNGQASFMHVSASLLILLFFIFGYIRAAAKKTA